MSNIFRTASAKAAKAHTCIWCGEGIAVGDTYIRQVLVYDGDFQSNAYHPECFDLIGDCDLGLDEGFSPYGNPRPKEEGAKS